MCVINASAISAHLTENLYAGSQKKSQLAIMMDLIPHSVTTGSLTVLNRTMETCSSLPTLTLIQSHRPYLLAKPPKKKD